MTKYTLKTLTDYCTEKHITLIKDYSNETIHRRIPIEGKCIESGCENNFKKNWEQLLLNENYYCITCTYKYRSEKIKDTCMKRYGVKNVLQNKEIKEKIKNTNINKYGTAHPLQNKEVLNKVQATCMEKYGVINTFQNEEFKEKSKKTCMEKYGVESIMHNDEIKNRVKTTNIEKYGTTNPSKNEDVKQKIVETTLRNHGVKCALQSKDIREKGKQTMMIKYGVESAMQSDIIKDRVKQTNIERYGVENVFQSELHKEKIKNTIFEKYGVENVMYDPIICNRSLHNMAKKKSYILPSGKEIFVQGYEPFALDILFKNENILEEDIETDRDKVPEIWYYDPDGIKHRHYVDIYIKSQNRCIEIKSEWTIKMKHCYVFEKQSSAKENGYKYEIWVISESGDCIEKFISY